MPLGIQRLNQRQRHPNDRITFIKPLLGPTSDIAHQFLSRIAAQCLPIMKSHSLSVTTLEEHEPNREFVGRNFNGGEIIQLVLHPLLKTGGAGDRWLPFGYVQMVMMHELAHCVQMNHSRAFWAVRNGYAEEMRGLWGRGYTGEGMWGRGRALESGAFDHARMPDADEMPQNLCGGTYRRRGRKRRRGANTQGGGEKLRYAERKQRRIEKKFGKEGQDLGGDEAVRRYLEKGKLKDTAPRVAKSKRGRDLRAMAVELRMKREKAEREADEELRREDQDNGGGGEEEETVDEYEDGSGDEVSEGENGMVKVCDDEDGDDQDARNEMVELSQMNGFSYQRSKLKRRDQHTKEAMRTADDESTTEDEDLDEVHQIDTAPPEFTRRQRPPSSTPQKRVNSTRKSRDSPKPGTDDTAAFTAQNHQELSSNSKTSTPDTQDDASIAAPSPAPPNKDEAGTSTDDYSHPQALQKVTRPSSTSSQTHDTGSSYSCAPPPSASTRPQDQTTAHTSNGASKNPTLKLRSPSVASATSPAMPTIPAQQEQTCPICSLSNPAMSLTCAACSHVLDTSRLTRWWRCQNATCQSLGYVSPEDAGRCGLCGTAPP
ncbi:MAG: hypothetical protein Q9162_007272 [Coniocarpon cinnabarinum]